MTSTSRQNKQSFSSIQNEFNWSNHITLYTDRRQYARLLTLSNYKNNHHKAWSKTSTGFTQQRTHWDDLQFAVVTFVLVASLVVFSSTLYTLVAIAGTSWTMQWIYQYQYEIYTHDITSNQETATECTKIRLSWLKVEFSNLQSTLRIKVRKIKTIFVQYAGHCMEYR